MLKDITLGQYYPTESVIHRLDPRVKLVATLMYIVSLFLFHDFVGFIVVTLFLIAIIRMSHVPFSFMLKGDVIDFPGHDVIFVLLSDQ